jgi:hypothetical protein
MQKTRPKKSTKNLDELYKDNIFYQMFGKDYCLAMNKETNDRINKKPINCGCEVKRP